MSMPARLSLFPLLAAPALSACGSGGEHAHGVPDGPPVVVEDAGPKSVEPEADAGPEALDCTGAADGTEGCPCETAGATVFCGKVYRISAGYVSCSDGNAVCGKDLLWGPCIGDAIAHVP